ncbi:MAG: hypothetical protein WC966_12430 [Bradymonadales bacterium]|jgi:hypothetical protein
MRCRSIYVFMLAYIFIWACELPELLTESHCPPLISSPCCPEPGTDCRMRDVVYGEPCVWSEENRDPKSGRCVAGFVCGLNEDLYACVAKCSDEQRLCDNKCTDINVDPQHCGECYAPCPMGSRCEKGVCRQNCADGYILCGDGDERRCVDPLTDLEFCGAQNECGHNDVGVECAEGMLCSGGVCAATCANPYVQCSREGRTYCADFSRDLKNCGSCGNVCDEIAVPNGKSFICDGVCEAKTCIDGYYVHDGKCEQNTTIDCGHRGNNCGFLAGWANGECTNEGLCVASECKVGYRLENGVCQTENNECCGNECMVCDADTICNVGKCVDSCIGLNMCRDGNRIYCANFESDTANCTECGTVCDTTVVLNSTAVYCDNGCKAASCEAGYYLDDGKCEQNTTIDCGHRGNNCGFLAGWANGECTNEGLCVATECKVGYRLENGVCVPDTNACCGSICKTCGAGTVCSNGECSPNCGAGLELCGDSCVNLASSIDHCGSCNNNCTTDKVPDSNSVYCDSVCTASSCNSGYYLSDGKCLAYDEYNCGAAGYDCSNLTGWEAGTCTSGACVATSCEAGYHLATGVCVPDTNACCGSTCKTCGTGTVCSNGECLANCGAGLELCGDKCVNLASSIDHCGSCNNNCTTSTVPESSSVYCDNGCKASSCNSGYYLSNGECLAYDEYNCGAAGYDCSSLTGWEEGDCTSGACVATTCVLGYHVNNGTCVADTNIACGSTDIDCTAQNGVNNVLVSYCESGECVLYCETGYNNCDGDNDTGCETTEPCP